MDDVDVRIVRLLTWKPFDPVDQARGILMPADIARILDVHPSTITRRIQRMRDEDILQGVHLIPYPRLLGVEMALYRFRWADALAKTRGAEAIMHDHHAMDGITFVGDEAWIALGGPDQEALDGHARRLALATGAVEADLVERRIFDTSMLHLRDLDRRIMEAFHDDWLRPLADVAEDVGVTAKTVRARLDALARAHAFLIIPDFACERIEGGIPFALTVEVEDAADPEQAVALLRAFPDAFVRGFPGTPRPYVVTTARTGADMDAMVRRAVALPGVRQATHRVIEGTFPCKGIPQPAETPRTLQPA